MADSLRSNEGVSLHQRNRTLTSLTLHRWCPGEDGVVLSREIFDQDLILVRGKLCAAAAEAGAFTGEVIGEGVAIPVGELVVGSAWRKAQDQAIVFDRDFKCAEVFV